ncbi:shikimate kinase [Methanothrix soehngenii]|uniref:shikimate kinase n=2 Tax=Methanotrichaceae TaxID=143067 RepID=UPI0023F2CCE9|nr:shikimate kinase [Methanothrix soehngenii]
MAVKTKSIAQRAISLIVAAECIDSFNRFGRFFKNSARFDLFLRCRNSVIATGGSVVMSPRAMEHLISAGTVIYLKVPFEEIEKRLGNISGRGIVLFAGQSLRMMYDQRVSLYEQYADITIDCAGLDFETVVGQLLLCI